MTDPQTLIMKGSSSLSNIAKRLQGKVALTSGGASGIGESTKRLLPNKALRSWLLTSKVIWVSLYATKSSQAQAVSYIHCDVTSDSGVQTAVNAAVSMHVKLDIMLSNAGVSGNHELSTLAIIMKNSRERLIVDS